MARVYHFTPEQVAMMTDAQIDMYLGEDAQREVQQAEAVADAGGTMYVDGKGRTLARVESGEDAMRLLAELESRKHG